MGHAHAADQNIVNPGSLKSCKTMFGVFVGMTVIGILAFFITLGSDPSRAWASLLNGHFYFMGLAIAALFFVVISWITTSMWTAPVIRIAEGLTSYLPFVLVSLVLVFLGAHHLYVWTHPEHVRGDLVLEGKQGFLNLKFFMVRNFLAVVIWIAFARKIVSGSLGVDKTGDYKSVYGINRKLGVIFLAIFAITFSMAAFDQLMSLDAHWFSTMFGVYIFGGFYQTFFATLAIIAILMKRAGYLSQVFNENHLHDIAKFMFAFTVFWAYTGFSQYMLIWYANLPEETGYFILRFNPGWEKVSIALFMGKFVFPFFALLSRGNKRDEKVVFIVACWILAMQYLDLTWIIQPQFRPEGLQIGFSEVGVWLGFLGVFGLIVSRFYQKNSVITLNNPYMADSAFHHHV